MRLISKSIVDDKMVDDEIIANYIVPFGMAIHYENLVRGAVNITKENSIDIFYIIEEINRYLKNSENFKVYICFREKGITFFSNIDQFNDTKVLFEKTTAIWCLEKVSHGNTILENIVLVDLTEELLITLKKQEYPNIDISEYFTKYSVYTC